MLGCKELRDVHVNNMPTDRYLKVLLYEYSNCLYYCTYCKLVLSCHLRTKHSVNVEIHDNDFIIDNVFYILCMNNCMSTLLMSILNSSLLASVCLCVTKPGGDSCFPFKTLYYLS